MRISWASARGWWKHLYDSWKYTNQFKIRISRYALFRCFELRCFWIFTIKRNRLFNISLWNSIWKKNSHFIIVESPPFAAIFISNKCFIIHNASRCFRSVDSLYLLNNGYDYSILIIIHTSHVSPFRYINLNAFDQVARRSMTVS